MSILLRIRSRSLKLLVEENWIESADSISVNRIGVAGIVPQSHGAASQAVPPSEKEAVGLETRGRGKPGDGGDDTPSESSGLG